MAANLAPNPTNPIAGLLSYWRGERPLGRLFWVYGVAASSVLYAILAIGLATSNTILQQAMLPVLAIYTLWIVVSVWRCAPNAENELHQILARYLTVAWAINSALILVALELGLLPALLR